MSAEKTAYNAAFNLSAELEALRRWKNDAIARFPELGLDPVILAARQRVAAILREEGNPAKAALVERGELDAGETMRIVLSIMGDVK